MGCHRDWPHLVNDTVAVEIPFSYGGAIGRLGPPGAMADDAAATTSSANFLPAIPRHPNGR